MKTALTNAEIKMISSLQQKKFREAEGLFVVEGPKMVAELLKSNAFEVTAIIHTEDWVNSGFEGETDCVNEKTLQRISGLVKANEVLALVQKPFQEKIELTGTTVIILDDVRDPGNLGTILRTASWFGIEHVLLSTNCVDEFNPKVVQSTMGALFQTKVHRAAIGELIEMVKDAGFEVRAATMEGDALKSFERPEKVAIVLGNESNGVSRRAIELCDGALHIEGKGSAESLNVSIATAIFCSHLC